MTGKSVKVNDIGILSFFYPDYKVRDNLYPYDRGSNIIFTGTNNKTNKERLESYAKNYIIVSAPYEYDISTTVGILNWISNKVKITQKQYDALSALDYYYVLDIVKKSFILGKLAFKSDSCKFTLYDLFKSVTGQFNDILGVYYELIKYYPPYVVESSMMTFLYRVISQQEQNVSPNYLKLINTVKQSLGSRLDKVLYQELFKQKTSSEFSFISLLAELRGPVIND